MRWVLAVLVGLPNMLGAFPTFAQTSVQRALAPVGDLLLMPGTTTCKRLFCSHLWSSVLKLKLKLNQRPQTESPEAKPEPKPKL